MKIKDKITVLVAGASGATGRLLVEQLLDLTCKNNSAFKE